MSEKRYKIVRLMAENVKRIKVVDITPEGPTVVIGGDNGQGKTSILDSIMYALSGSRSICERPIRDGEKTAQVVCELEDFIVTRTWNASGTKLEVKSKDGAKYGSPQGLLDSLTSTLTFDPLAFATEDPKKQANTLKELAGITFDDLNKTQKLLHEERLDIGRLVKTLVGQREGVKVHADAPAELVKVSEITEKMESARKNNGAINALHSDIQQREQELQKNIEQINRLQTANDEITAFLDKAKAERSGLQYQDIAPLQAELEGVEELNGKVRDNENAARLDAQIEEARAAYARLTENLAEIETQKADRLASADLPIDGLSFDDDGVVYQGVPFSQASAAERLRVSVAMGLALNPGIRVMLIRDGSLLDSSNMKMIADMAEANDAQIWIERVGDGKEVSVVIESGEVLETR